MRKKFIILLFLAITFIPQVSSQTCVLVSSTSVKGNFFLTDHLGFFYVIDNQRIIKYDQLGNKQGEYSNNYLGAISYADVSDPLRILLFYQEFNQIQFIDHNLAELGSPVLLDELGNDQTSIVCSSVSAGFWAYNPQLRQLLHFSKTLQIDLKGTLLQSVINEDVFPSALLDKNENLYLSDPGKGILIFDKYGIYIRTLPIMNLKLFQAADNYLTFYKNEKYWKYNMTNDASEEIPLPDSTEVIDVRTNSSLLYLFKSTGVSVYKNENK
jgi:hypothetical protein